MAGNHRATRAKERSRVPARAAAVTIVVAMVPLLWFAGSRILDGEETLADRGALGPEPTTSVSVTPRATPEATATPTKSVPTPTKTATAAPRLPRLAPAVPRRLVSGTFLDVGFDDSTEPSNGSFRTASSGEATRWGSRGLPGSPGTDTVYLIGRTIAGSDSAFATLPRLKAGSKVTIRTDRGRLTYTVTSARNRPAAGLAARGDLAAKSPGRLVLIGLRSDAAGDTTGQAYVVVAELSAVRPG